ncbi:MAG: histidine kinase dimerization/phospho-acceptor domain-containing protein, partial [Pseudomonadota bacterium]
MSHQRLTIFILVFFAALAAPLGLLANRAWQGLGAEEQARVRFSAESLMDGIQGELADLVQALEDLPVDQYAEPPGEGLQRPYVLGLLQGGADGGFTAASSPDAPDGKNTLEAAARQFSRLLASSGGLSPSPPRAAGKLYGQAPEPKEESFTDKYLSFPSRRAPSSLGQKGKRVEELTPVQAQNLARTKDETERQYVALAKEQAQEPQAGLGETKARESRAEADAMESWADTDAERELSADRQQEARRDLAAGSAPAMAASPSSPAGEALMESTERESPDARDRAPALRAEVDPLQALVLDDDRLFLFRRVLVDGRIFRQGAVISAPALVKDVAQRHFSGQPLAGFARFTLVVEDGARRLASAILGPDAPTPRVVVERTFPRPFSFLHAALACENPPPSPARRTLSWVLTVLAAVFCLGFFAIYRSARAVAEYSDRRARFVSSVTHELKTPLTNIRMYAEMLS